MTMGCDAVRCGRKIRGPGAPHTRPARQADSGHIRMSSSDSTNSVVVAPSEGRHTHSLREHKTMRFDRRRRDKSAVAVAVHQRCTRRLRTSRKHGIRALLRMRPWHVELPDLAPRTPKTFECRSISAPQRNNPYSLTTEGWGAWARVQGTKYRRSCD